MGAFTRGTAGHLTFLEGPPGQPLLRDADDTATLLEECFAVPTRSALLYAENLPAAFFDVSSLQAGTFLQKLRNYRMRMAVVVPADAMPSSQRFAQLADAERRDNTFCVFTSRDDALARLSS